MFQITPARIATNRTPTAWTVDGESDDARAILLTMVIGLCLLLCFCALMLCLVLSDNSKEVAVAVEAVVAGDSILLRFLDLLATIVA